MRWNSASKQVVDALAQLVVGHQRGVEARGAQVGLAQRHLHVAQQVDEERKLLGHGLQQFEGAGSGEELLDGIAHAEPRRNQQARLRPAEDPGNGAQVGELGRIVAARGARTDLGVFELAHGRALLKVSEDAGIFKDVLAVKPVSRRLKARRARPPTPA